MYYIFLIYIYHCKKIWYKKAEKHITSSYVSRSEQRRVSPVARRFELGRKETEKHISVLFYKASRAELTCTRLRLCALAYAPLATWQRVQSGIIARYCLVPRASCSQARILLSPCRVTIVSAYVHLRSNTSQYMMRKCK